MSAMRQKWLNRRIWEYLSEKLEKAFLLRARALNCYLISPPSKSWLKDFSLNDHFLLDVSTKPLIYPARVTISSKLFFMPFFPYAFLPTFVASSCSHLFWKRVFVGVIRFLEGTGLKIGYFFSFCRRPFLSFSLYLYSILFLYKYFVVIDHIDQSHKVGSIKYPRWHVVKWFRRRKIWYALIRKPWRSDDCDWVE